MALTNNRAAFGWAAIGLHWISAIGVTALYFLGDSADEAPTRAAKLAAVQTHVSVAVLLFTFLAARLLWSLSQPNPQSLESNRTLRMLALAVQKLFLLMIAVLLVSGPLAVWSGGEPISAPGIVSIPSPFPGPIHWLREAAEFLHGAAAKLFWPLIALHVAGALKHLVIDRDRTLQRMLWVRREA